MTISSANAVDQKVQNGEGQLTHDYLMASEFLQTLDPIAKKFTFNLIPDSGGVAQIVHSSLADIWSQILNLNTPVRGIGVFVTINATNFEGRRGENILRARALFVDADSDEQVETCYDTIRSTKMTPTMTVTTSNGRAHFYWVCESIPLDEFSEHQRAMIEKMGTDTSIKDLSRVMRLPGTLHLKNPQNPQLVILVRAQEQRRRYDLQELIDGFSIITEISKAAPLPNKAKCPFTDTSAPKRENASAEWGDNSALGAGLETNIAEIRSAVFAIPPSAITLEMDWTRFAMGLAHEASIFRGQTDQLLEILDAASKFAGTYDQEKNQSRWQRYIKESMFRENPITIASVFDLAKKHGWRGMEKPGFTYQGNTAPPGNNPADKFAIIMERDFSSLAEPTYVVDGLIPDRGVTVIYGASGSFKSFIGLELAASVASGCAAFGKFPVKQGDVVIAAGEAPHALARKRMPAWKQARGISKSIPLGMFRAVPNVSNSSEVQAFIASIKKAGMNPKLVIIDTVARAMPGLDENDAVGAGQLIQASEQISRELGCAVILIHHSGKDETKGMRGSSAIPAGADAIFKVKRSPDSLAVSLSCEKMKDADEPPRIHLRGELVAGSLVFSAITEVEYVQASRTNPPLSPATVGKALQTAQGVEIDTYQLALALLPIGVKDPSAIEAMKKRLQRGAKKQLAAYLVPGTGGRRNPTRWTFPVLAGSKAPGPSSPTTSSATLKKSCP